MEEGAYSRAEQLLAAYLSKETPAESLAALYLETATRAGGRQGLDGAYAAIKRIYQKELGLPNTRGTAAGIRQAGRSKGIDCPQITLVR